MEYMAKKIKVTKSKDTKKTAKKAGASAAKHPAVGIGRLVGKTVIGASVELVEREAVEKPVESKKTEVKTTDLGTLSEKDLTDVPVVTTPSKDLFATSKSKAKPSAKKGKWWPKAVLIGSSAVLLIGLITGVALSQFYKNRALPGISVAGIPSGSDTRAEIKSRLEKQAEEIKLTIKTGDKKLEPKREEIGYSVDIDKTVQKAYEAKRKDGFFKTLAFWEKTDVPALINVNETLLNQYIESNTPELSKSPTDATLAFNTEQDAFTVTNQADGSGPDLVRLKDQLYQTGSALKSQTIELAVVNKKPNITEEALKPYLPKAEEIISRHVQLVGAGRSFVAQRADIADWITPTPQENGSLSLEIDPAKVQSYVDGVGKRISTLPQDRKIIKDTASGAEVVLQEGRDGTTLTDPKSLAAAITKGIKDKRDVVETMNIEVAAFKTVNMDAYEKWIEVDLSEQRLTAYERATPVKTSIVATGMAGYETPVGEYSVWLRVRSQTMQGGSKADGSYYNLPNVEWVTYFYKDYAIHGAYWRRVFGVPGSHGCVNMTNEDAKWIYEWAPLGTKVIVHR